LPVAAYASVDEKIHLRGLVASPDGTQVVGLSAEGDDARELGQRLAARAIALGARDILRWVPAGN
jgi:porphobilinogen deaminase